MTHDDRLDQQTARSQATSDARRQRLARAKAARQSAGQKARMQRRYRVGLMAERAGLMALDDATLGALLPLLAPLAQTPDPVAVLAALIASLGCPGT